MPKSLLVYSAAPQATSQPPNLPRSDADTAPAVVLDTNVVLDWLVFKDAQAGPLTEALAAGTLRWLTCRRMRDELERTLAYPALAKWNPDSEHVLTIFDRQGTAQPDPPPAPLDLRCSDPDDQVFLDLALATRARWLLTHDRALLKLARRAGRSGLHILPPARWPGP